MPAFQDQSPRKHQLRDASQVSASNDTKIAGHACLLVFDDVAMQQPVARIVGHEAELHLLIGLDQVGVRDQRLDLALRRGEHREAHAMQMDGVGMRRQVLHVDDVAFSQLQLGQWRSWIGRIARPRHLVDGPEAVAKRTADAVCRHILCRRTEGQPDVLG